MSVPRRLDLWNSWVSDYDNRIRIIADFCVEDGLKHDGATMAQIPSYVTSLPDGTDTGLYLAVDLGGTNLRVCAVDLLGDSTYSMKQSKVAIPSQLMLAATFSELFAFIATRLHLFLQKHHPEYLEASSSNGATTAVKKDNILLGFTFSFAFEQQALDRGTLLRWTKGFNIPDAIGMDICSTFQSEIDKLQLPVIVAALVNDTVGTLLARSYTSPGKSPTLLGAIFGTGTNGAYVERMSRLTKLKKGEKPTGDEMIVNSEWGSFDNEMKVLPDTVYDQALDTESVHPGIQMFEKRISGMYLGEVLRHAIVGLLSSQGSVNTSSKLHEAYTIDSSFLSMAASDDTAGLTVIRKQLDLLLEIDASVEIAEAVKILALAIGRRAARLAGVAIAGVIIKSGRLSAPIPTGSKKNAVAASVKTVGDVEQATFDSSSDPARKRTGLWSMIYRVFATTAWWLSLPLRMFGGGQIKLVTDRPTDMIDVGVDGSLFEFYPKFEEIIRGVLQEVEEIGIEGERRVQIGKAQDGSGVGAALAARAAGKARELEANKLPK